MKTNGGSPPKSKALSPQGLKKPAAAPNPISEVRSDLLKAIRDGTYTVIRSMFPCDIL